MAMSVLLVGNFLSSARGIRCVGEELAARFDRAGWSVMTTSTCLSRVPRLFDMISTSWLQRSHFDVAIVEVYSGAAFFWAEVVCWTLQRAHKPYILALHGGKLPSFAQRWPSRVRRLFQSAAAVTVPSRFLLEQMRLYRDDMRLVPNGINLGNYKFKLRQRPQPLLIWLRAFHSIYNPALAPKVLAMLTRDCSDVYLTMVGPDKGDGSLQSLQQLATELDVVDRIVFSPAVSKSEVSLWMNKGDIFLNTTNVDNTPVTVLEAMACGLCIISTNVGGIPYLLNHEENALLVPPENPAAMAESVHRLLAEPGLAERLSRNARKKAEQFDWSVIIPQWKSALKAAVRGQVRTNNGK